MLLFDLAEALEGEGETARALAICMELQADAGNYRDVAARIDRLATDGCGGKRSCSGVFSAWRTFSKSGCC